MVLLSYVDHFVFVFGTILSCLILRGVFVWKSDKRVISRTSVGYEWVVCTYREAIILRLEV